MYALVLEEEMVFLDKELREFTPQLGECEETVFLDGELHEVTPHLGECRSRDCHGGRALDVHMWSSVVIDSRRTR